VADALALAERFPMVPGDDHERLAPTLGLVVVEDSSNFQSTS
jgi:hypothetical protein